MPKRRSTRVTKNNNVNSSSSKSKGKKLNVSSEADDDSVYTVEKILNKRTMNDGQVQYFIKWKGFEDPKENTWEPAENCECPKLIEKFEKEFQNNSEENINSNVSERSLTPEKMEEKNEPVVKRHKREDKSFISRREFEEFRDIAMEKYDLVTRELDKLKSEINNNVVLKTEEIRIERIVEDNAAVSQPIVGLEL